MKRRADEMEDEKRGERSDKSRAANSADQLFKVSSNIHIPRDLLFNILKRLPAKSLMRFKCVSKAWQTLIYDPYFAESHQTHSQTRPDAHYLLFCYRIYNYLGPQSVFPTNLEATFSSQLPAHVFNVTTSSPCTEIVNGLTCLYDRVECQLRILNLTTGEKSAPLPTGRLKSSAVFQLFEPSYHLGFDPVSKGYKLLHFGRNLDGKKECEILTFGDRSWRMIDYPKYEINGRDICLNGTIYWKNELVLFGETVIQYLDLQKEKFSVLFPPKGSKPIEHLTQVGRNFGIVCGRYYEPQVLWTLCSKDQVWMKIDIKLPRSIWNWDRQYIGTTKTGEMLVTARRYIMEDMYEYIFYDLDTGKFRTAELRWPGKAEITHALMAYAAYPAVSNHVENILPLRCSSEGNIEENSEKWAKVRVKECFRC